MITRQEFIKETVPGKRVVHKVSGYTGEVRLVFPEWGVEVWNPSRGNERERWSWDMITKRFPRFIKRFPRPFRFPRKLPILQCHCKVGKMEAEGENQIRCLRCSFLIGSEAFPRRFERATKLLRKWLDQHLREKHQEKRKRKARSANLKKAGSKKRKITLGIQGRKGKRNLVLRSKGGKEVHSGKAKRKGQRKRNKAVSKNNQIPKVARNNQRKKGKRKN